MSRTSEPPKMVIATRPRVGRDAQVVLAIAVVSALLIVGLMVISRDAPSAKQLDSVSLVTAGVSGEVGCTNFADFWMNESGIALPAEAISALTNCRQSPDGEWFVPANPADPRLRDSDQLSADEQTDVAVLSAQLADDLAALELILPRSLRESLKANFESENLAVFGHTRRGRTDLGAKWARYMRVTQAFLLSPQRAVAADYVGWLMERRLAAVESFEVHCSTDPDDRFLAMACNGLREEFGVRRIPLYWVLTDPILIQEYLVDRARRGEPLPAVTPSLIS